MNFNYRVVNKHLQRGGFMRFKKMWANVMPMVCVVGMLLSAEAIAQSEEGSKIDSTKADSSMKAMNMKGMKMPIGTMAKDTSIGYWTCTMHPEVRKAGPGNCPICGMKLVYKKNGKNTNGKKCMDSAKMKCMDTSKMKHMKHSKMKCMDTTKIKCMDTVKMGK